ncbi:hypothetical protein [Aureibacter tunicatorum]|uniref:Uncharacterized protein n=1 Tax=Aureibacter tunicatorum TaxID=866807 RepID=A0AAE3XU73_9BACT|nr:hypothetical protein [Aureibacter tunicatorum]MDR6242085.1 hypothetical protein [Aureibacter tunicatorum]BDD07562.1 hypothetical protein AUTU_50450 [Aureibacter tunicatorum]
MENLSNTELSQLNGGVAPGGCIIYPKPIKDIIIICFPQPAEF